MKTLTINPKTILGILLMIITIPVVMIINAVVKDIPVSSDLENDFVIPKIKVTKDSYPKQLYRGISIDKNSKRGVLVPHGMDINGNILNGALTDPQKHVYGDNYSIWSSFTLRFRTAFNWSHSDRFGHVQDGIILIADEYTIPNIAIFNTITKLGDPFNEDEILIKGVLCGFKVFYTYKYDTWESAYNRAISMGLIK